MPRVRLIFPAVQIQEDYQHNMDIVRMCRMRMRVPDQWWAIISRRSAQRGWRARGPGPRPRGRLRPARRLYQGVVRLQREADGRGYPRHAEGQGDPHQHPRSLPGDAAEGVTIKVTVEVKRKRR